MKKRIIAEIENNFGYKAEIEDLGISPFLVVKLEKLNLSSERDQVEIVIDKLEISPSLTSLLFDSNKVPFNAQVGQGNVKGTVVYSGSGNRLYSFRVRLNNIDSRIVSEFTKDKKGVPEFDGEVSGDIDIELVKDGVEEVNGEFNLYSDSFSLSKSRVDSFTIPPYRGLQVALEGKMEKNKTYLDRLQLKNKDFDLNLSGTMPLLWRMKGGMLDLSVNLVLNSNQAKMSFLQAFMKKENDGSLSTKIAGTFSKPQFIKGETL